jgi:hypothetical protein
LAEINEDGNKVGETKLDAHPESFQLEKDSPRIYVNLPKSRKIAVGNAVSLLESGAAYRNRTDT